MGMFHLTGADLIPHKNRYQTEEELPWQALPPLTPYNIYLIAATPHLQIMLLREVNVKLAEAYPHQADVLDSVEPEFWKVIDGDVDAATLSTVSFHF